MQRNSHVLRSFYVLGTALVWACQTVACQHVQPLPSSAFPRLVDTVNEMPIEQRRLAGVTDVTWIERVAGEKSANETDTRYNVFGTDLGSMFSDGYSMYMVFGDTVGCCPPGTGGPGFASDWRRNTMAILRDANPSDGLRVEQMICNSPGRAAQLIRHDPWEVTVIPTYGVAVAERLIVHYMGVSAWSNDPTRWVLTEAGLASSLDGGLTWKRHRDVRWHGDSNFGQVAIANHYGTLYFLGIPAGRRGGVALARVAAPDVLEKSAYRYFVRDTQGRERWSADEREATWIIPPPVGELSVIWNPYLSRWLVMYRNAERGLVVLREAEWLTGPWSKEVPVLNWPDAYAPFMHARYVEEEGAVIYFTISRWGPYIVALMKARLVRS